MKRKDLRKKAMGFTLIELMIVIAIIAILASVLVPNFIRARGGGQLTACKANLKNVATSLELYSTDHSGRFPDNMTTLTPNYLKTLPRCPVAQVDTYSGSYVATILPDTYVFYCEGQWHVGMSLPPDYPQYFSESGLVERP